jgi:hypothetical protein
LDAAVDDMSQMMTKLSANEKGKLPNVWRQLAFPAPFGTQLQILF